MVIVDLILSAPAEAVQSTSNDSVFKLVGVVGAALASSLTLLGWLVKRVFNHAFTHTIPRLARDFKESLKETNDNHREDMREARTEYKAALKIQGDYFKEELRQERAQIGGRVEYLASRVEKLEDTIRERVPK